MNKTEVQTIGSRSDQLLVAAALAVALAGVVGFSFWSDQILVVRLLLLVGGLAGGLVIGWFSLPGKRFIAFSREAYDEAKKVTWPTRKETVNTTAVVFAFVVVMGLFLFLIDKAIEWGLYDLVLGWK